jgi:putative chitinase
MIYRPFFYDSVRASLFGGKLKQSQVDGLELLLSEACNDDRQRAYILATAYHETARTMQPIREIGRGKGKPYGLVDPETGHAYYGRGFVQLTWRPNYAWAAEHMGVDFVRDPDAVMIPAYASKILFDGMFGGWFTGRTVQDYINASKTDYVNARRVVNGTDKASTIAGYAGKFHAALSHTAGA